MVKMHDLLIPVAIKAALQRLAAKAKAAVKAEAVKATKAKK